MTLCGYRTWLVHFGIVRFFAAIPTGDEGTRRTRNGGGGTAWARFCARLLALPCFPRGERWGCAPQTAPKSHWLSGLSSFGARQSTFLPNLAITAIFEQRTYAAQHSGTRKDLTGSNLWPVRSGCMKMLSIRTNVQTRAAPKRRGVGLRARSGVAVGTAYRCRPFSRR